MRYCFDLDNTLCTTIKSDYNNSIVIEKNKNLVNNLYKKGHYIIINTARGASSGIDWTEFTKKQINNWGLKYHELITNKKPNADFFIDDKNLSIEELEKNTNKITGIVAGAFDIIHNGYIKYFKDAKKYCTELVVALHEDPSKERSEKNKPIHSVEERIEILKSLIYVDKIITYKTEEDLLNIIKNVKPHIRILDESYKNKIITGKSLSKIIYHKRDHSYSYTSIKDKILGQDAVKNKINEIILTLVDKDVENIDKHYLSKKDLINNFLDLAIKNMVIKNGLILEFGVFKGRTINYIASKLTNNIVYGFDSFEGLPGKWNTDNPKGKFSLNGKMPRVKKNVRLIKGWFNQTLPSFKKDNNQKISLLHIDCDMYESTKCIFDNLKDQIVDGTIIILDEIWKYPGYKDHEIKAFAEFLVQNGLKFKCIKTIKNRYAKGIFIIKK